WEIAARSAGRLHQEHAPKSWRGVDRGRSEAFEYWRQIEQALSKSVDPKDRELADEVRRFIVDTPGFAHDFRRMPVHQQFRKPQQREVEHEQRSYERGREITGPER